ncbi:MAG: aminotransferase class V-fold PLP-dependent enzyme [Tetrasphaera jenkinsii]|jgi:glutamate/tyrosine decarboxylase-like PLP-dependent enzyme|nr:aminotransferase class V-fold PLP-dependent enzyme [Tetrasphaera jenkinsii]
MANPDAKANPDANPTVDPAAVLTDVLADAERLRARDLPVHGGRTLAYVYDSGVAEADAAGRAALAEFGGTNGLDPTAFPSILAMEQDLVAFARDLLHGPETTVGTATSGGTESILMAVLAARDASPRGSAAAARPSMVLPSTAHAAFRKAAHYFGVRPVVVDVDPVTYRAKPGALARAIDDTTILVVASAPSYAHGVIDPVPAIAAAAATRGVRCHVDACIGGMILPFLDGVRPWDFAVEGVTSVSVDLHKYGYAPKGISLLLHRTPALRRGQYFATADWPGYTMLNTTAQSTKSGGPVAAAWAVARVLGHEGYAALARSARQACLDITRGVGGIPGIDVVATPDSTLLALSSTRPGDVYLLADELADRGWFVQPQLPYAASPATLHLSLSAATAPLVPEFLSALAEAAATVRSGPQLTVGPGIAAVLAALDPASLTDAMLDGLLAVAGMTAPTDGSGVALPRRMAPVNALLECARIPLREALLLAVLDRLNRPAAASDQESGLFGR